MAGAAIGAGLYFFIKEKKKRDKRVKEIQEASVMDEGLSTEKLRKQLADVRERTGHKES